MNEMKDETSTIDWFLKIPLYQELSWKVGQVWKILNIKYFKGTLDSFCIECQRKSTFRGVTPERPVEHTRNLRQEVKTQVFKGPITYPTIDAGIFIVMLQCTRNESHFQHFIFLIKNYPQIINKTSHIKSHINSTIQKIGQYPSFGDLNIPKVKKYTKVLNKKNLGELTRAIGLASHDVGVGSYIYLRRVFESLIEEAHQSAKLMKGWNDSKYLSARMLEKISMLQDFLPEFLAQNRHMYSLLSKGVHKLTEEECLEHFDTLKISIELILDEKVEKYEKDKKIKKAKKALQKAIEKNKGEA